MENIFFDLKKLGKLGSKTIIGKTVRIRHPELCHIDDNCIIDDFTYISTKLELGVFTHIAPHVVIAGGSDFLCKVGKFCGIGSGSKLYCDSNDFEKEITSIIPKEFRYPTKSGDIIMQDFSGMGVNAVVLPNVEFSEGSVLAALSLVPANTVLKPWTLYTGIPAKPIKKRNKKLILKQAKDVGS